MLSNSPLNISFRRALTGDKWDAWSHRLMEVQLLDTPNVFVRKLTTNGLFTVNSMYEDMMNGDTLREYLSKL